MSKECSHREREYGRALALTFLNLLDQILNGSCLSLERRCVVSGLYKLHDRPRSPPPSIYQKDSTTARALQLQPAPWLTTCTHNMRTAAARASIPAPAPITLNPPAASLLCAICGTLTVTCATPVCTAPFASVVVHACAYVVGAHPLTVPTTLVITT